MKRQTANLRRAGAWVATGSVLVAGVLFNGNILVWRGFLVNGDPKPAVDIFHKLVRVYPLDKAQAEHPPKFVDNSGRSFNTTHSSTAKFYEEVNEVVQEEPVASMDPETLGLLAAICIEKGRPFRPDYPTSLRAAPAVVRQDLATG